MDSFFFGLTQANAARGRSPRRRQGLCGGHRAQGLQVLLELGAALLQLGDPGAVLGDHLGLGAGDKVGIAEPTA